jgi:hypothetical protein
MFIFYFSRHEELLSKELVYADMWHQQLTRGDENNEAILMKVNPTERKHQLKQLLTNITDNKLLINPLKMLK